MVEIVRSNQYNQWVKINHIVEIKWVVSYHEGASARLAMCLYLTVVTWKGSKALAFGGSRQVAPSLEATFIGE